MKKRLLALCLAAAMLLGMMPALTMPAKAAAPADQSLVIDPNATGYALSLAEDGNRYIWNAGGPYWDLRVWRGASTLAWNMPAALDHSYNMRLDLNMNVYPENQYDTSDGTITVNTDGTVTANGWLMKITDTDANGGVVFANRYFDGTTWKVRFLLPDCTSSAPVDLGADGSSAFATYSILWKADGSAAVLYNSVEKGAVEGVTWTHAQIAEKGISAAAADGIDVTCRFTYAASASGTTRTARAFLKGVTVTHTLAPVLLNGDVDLVSMIASSDGTVLGTGSTLTTAGFQTRWRDTFWHLQASGNRLSHTLTTPAESFLLDHSKDMVVKVQVNFANGNTKLDDSTAPVLDQGMLTTVVDGDTGNYIAANLYKDSTGAFKIAMEGADNTVSLGNGALSGGETYLSGVVTYKWHADGSVTVYLDGVEKGSFTGVTMTDASLTADKVQIDYRYDAQGISGCQAYLYQINVTHEEPPAPPAPAAVNAYFTAETLTAEGALTESSWVSADFVEVATGISAAVLVNKGTAYVALKSATAETATVKLGEAEAEATFKNGVAEVSFANAVNAYGATAELTVGTDTANVTFVTKTVNLEEIVVSGSLNLKNNGTGNFTLGGSYCDFSANNATRNVYITAAKDSNLVLDTTKQTLFNLGANVYSANGSATTGAASIKDNKIAVTNGFLVTLKDYESGKFLYAYLTNSPSNEWQMGFLKPDGTTNVYVPLGISSTANTSYVSIATLRWNPNGSVDVISGGVVKGSVLGVTWTVDSTKDAGTAWNPTADATGTATTSDFIRYDNKTMGNRILLVDSGIAATYQAAWPYTAVKDAYDDIATTLEQDLVAAIEDDIDTNDLAYLPPEIDHDYLGTIALTWSDTAELVSANGMVKIPETDTETTLTAKVGEDVIWTGTATVKAADPIYALFTPNANATWGNAIFAQLNNSTDTVAVLAENKDTVYVAVKGANGPATVILGGVEEPITIVDGMGVATFNNVGMSAYGEQRTIKVTTATGSLETKVIFDAKQIKLPTPNTISTVLYENLPSGYPSTGMKHTAGETLIRIVSGQSGLWTKSGEYGDIVIDRSQNVKINLAMSFQEGFFTGVKSSLYVTDGFALSNYVSNVVRFTIKDYETATFLNVYLTADENQNILLGFLENDLTTNTYVDLGVSVADDGKDFKEDGTTPDIYSVSLNDLYLVWNTDGSVTVMLGDEVKDTVQNATWTVNTGRNPGRAENPTLLSAGATATAYDFVNVTSGTSGSNQGYFNGLSFTTMAPAEVEDITLYQEGDYKYNLDLGSDIGFNFKVPYNPGATITVNAADVQTIYNATEDNAEDGMHLVEANVAGAQMTRPVSVKVVDAYGFTIFDKTTTVKAYVASLSGLDAKTQTLVDAMVNYGAAAQKYFNYEIDDLITEEVSCTDALLGETAADYAATKDGSLDYISAKSATLRLEEKVVIRYYFNAESVEGLVFKCGGKTLTAEQKSEGVWYVDVEVNPQNMATMYTVTVDDTLSVTYSCMTYMTKYAADAELSELLKTMYDYYAAAVAYLAPAN